MFPAPRSQLQPCNTTDLSYSSAITQATAISCPALLAVAALGMQAHLQPLRYVALELLHQAVVAKQTTADFSKVAWV